MAVTVCGNGNGRSRHHVITISLSHLWGKRPFPLHPFTPAPAHPFIFVGNGRLIPKHRKLPTPHFHTLVFETAVVWWGNGRLSQCSKFIAPHIFISTIGKRPLTSLLCCHHTVSSS
ncbi:MAG: hypothetical protein GY943_37885 [Chloroflexi bacterium]|nr:hypothetical protein [Chloroflexota bacterium]